MNRMDFATTRLSLVTIGLLLPLGCTPPDDGNDSFFGSNTYTTTTLTTTTLGEETTGEGDGDGDGEPGDGDGDPIPANCGDGVVDAGEECDLGMANSDNGTCTSACQIAECGDGLLLTGAEDCDDGNNVNTDDCVMCNAAECGDGFVQAGVEECDDGNDVEDDGCTSFCTPGVCGDGVLQAGEQCDDGNLTDTDSCPSTCQLAFCGDGFIQAGVEVCDDGNTESNDACTHPFCTPAECGDGIVWDGMEECDDGDEEPGNACTFPDCTIAVCGDGFVQMGVEECDDGNMDDTDFCMNDCTSNGYFDDFETNNLMLLPWTTNGNGNWATSNTSPHQGLYVAASATITHSQSTNLQVTLNVPQPGVVRFWYRVSSEGSFDYLRFYIDNVQQGNGWSGTVNWSQAQYNIGAGNHTFRWTYSKDGSVNSGSDKVWIDEVYVGVP